ncbi:Copper resistance protein A (plasmid) [Aquicella lusitana]|uniref:CopA family copper-resistance protein n=2 Tax=Aquicella lusitana TaxID=254246 RepID=A0A370G7G6_9COXI|nr:copper resistance system multicopper oxidase [Aquicella lusitana]RDI37963.1 CopA family copper-resistance protein [Aquicella lusitana]VVC74598.1 Copper resistance protein A [Aquicella lusitana]
MGRMCVKKTIWIILLNIFSLSPVFAAERVINLVVDYKTVYFAGKPRKAIAVNNQIPAPTLHFKQGEKVTINVYNRLDKETAIHWHGVLVPWQMDGVLGITQQGIQPGNVFKYQFTLKQSGTYWYHAHAGLQEQQGLYGAFIIDPPRSPSYQYTKDYVVVLSDWSNTYPDQIFANLKKEGDYYSPRFPLQASLVKFIRDYRNADTAERKKLIHDYQMMQQMRMSIYDINDVAYDAFLLNGRSPSNPWMAPVKVGDTVRLRFIGAGGETIFRVKIPGTQAKMVHIQGNDVRPYAVNDFTVAPGETYDILLKIAKDEPYIIYAESADTVGAAYGALVTRPDQFVNFKQIMPFPEPPPVTREMMANMMMTNMDHGSMKMDMQSHAPTKRKSVRSMNHQMITASAPMGHHAHNMKSKTHEGMKINQENTSDHAMEMPIEPTILGDQVTPASMDPPAITETKTIGTKYQQLKAAIKTNDPNKPVQDVIRMELFGYMDRFIWMINGLPEYKTKPILLEPAKRYRLIFTNNSMMRHPMHIHGHWFILRNGHGAYDPLLHTIEVPPGGTAVADIDTDASGQWFFHCHMLYHMVAGMSRVFQYSTLIEISKGEAKPEDIVKQSNYFNRPIVRVDEVKPIDFSLVKHPMAHQQGLYFANFLDVGEDPFHNVQEITFKGLYGGDYNKLELLTEDAEVNKGKVENADIDIFYWRLISQFWAVKGGANYFYRPAKVPYWQPGIGVEGLMPYFIDTNLRGYYYAGSAKLDLELARDTQITNNFFLRLGIRSILASKTVTRAEIGSGLNQMRYIVRPYYRLMPGLNVFTEYEHTQDYGAFKNMQLSEGESASEDTLTVGLSVLF